MNKKFAGIIGLFLFPGFAFAEPALLDANAVDVTFQQNIGFAARGSIDGTSSGWAIESWPINQPDGTIDQAVVWPLKSPISMPVQGRRLFLNFILSCTSWRASFHTLGHFQLSYIVEPSPDLASTFVPMTPIDISFTDPGITYSLVDEQIIIGGSNPPRAIYEVQFVLSELPGDLTAFRLDVFDDNGTSMDDVNGLPTGGPGRASNGNFVLPHVSVQYFYVVPAPVSPPIIRRNP